MNYANRIKALEIAKEAAGEEISALYPKHQLSLSQVKSERHRIQIREYQRLTRADAH